LARKSCHAAHNIISLLTFIFSFVQACGVISSCQGLLEGREGIEVPGPAGTEAVKRVTKAQSLIGQFLTDSGVTDERITEYVAKHQ
jgi:hypothetical protein